MKKVLIAALLVLGLVTASSATLVTNMNQSAMYLRLLSRNASTDIDAVYYNPAGLTRLKDGWHIGLNNQTISQTKTIVNDFPMLISHQYDGKVSVPFYPDAFVVYKKGALAFSFGAGPSAGGGSADYAKGLPSFEWQFAALPTIISGMGIPTTKYSTDIAFEGSSIYLGFQFNVSYAFNDELSGAIGFRYVSAKNTYVGHISNIMVNPTYPALGLNGSFIPATTFFTAVGQAGYAALMADKKVDAAQTASGITPILSLNFAPMPNLNLAVKYEFQTKLTFTNATTIDNTGLFPNGAESRSDVPAFLSLGAEWNVLPELKATASFNYFFDKNANWEGRENFVNSNSYDLAVGLEYAISNMIALSAGYLHTQFSLASGYQSDMGFDLSADTFGGGARIKLSDKFDVDLGVFAPVYKTDQKSITYILSTGTPLGTYLEHYSMKTFGFAIGLNFHL
jgi:long-chain fatty acid transport protein